MELEDVDRRLIGGGAGAAAQFAMRILMRLGEVAGAERFIDIVSAHVDACFYNGKATLDFAQRLVADGGRVVVPTTLNIGGVDLLHPELYRGDQKIGEQARRLMECYELLGCKATWTCAPYQLEHRPEFGSHIAWAESNAIVFANSVLGARTNRYGDFVDVCAALCGRVPYSGFHLADRRIGEVLFQLAGVPEKLLSRDIIYPTLGHLIGVETGKAVPVIQGLPASATADQLKALGAAAASSGEVAMFHAVGITPEAATLEEAFGGRSPRRIVDVTKAMISKVHESLTTGETGQLAAISLGTPHFSFEEFAQLVPLVRNLRLHRNVDFYVSTGRDVLARVETEGWLETLERAGIKLVVDTCTYLVPILRPRQGVVMTNSAKWAYYAPANLGVDVAFGSLEECVKSAEAGAVVRDPEMWLGA